MPESPHEQNGMLQDLKIEILQMQRDVTHGSRKPHKLVLLLAVIELVEKGGLLENKIYFDTPLVDEFEVIFNLIRGKGDWCQPAIPFFHLRTSSFWKHKIRPGREAAYAKLSTSGGGTKRVTDNIEYAYLSDPAYTIIFTADPRKDLKEFITSLLNPYSNFESAEPGQSITPPGR